MSTIIVETIKNKGEVRMRYRLVIFLLFMQFVLSSAFSHPSASSKILKIAFIDINGHLILAASDGTQQTQLSPMQVTLFKWSPDGKKLLFCACSEKRGNDENTPFYIMDIDSKKATHLDDVKIGSAPTWSPDGNQISFLSSAKAEQSLYVVNADGTEKYILAQTKGTVLYGSWSPDGQYIGVIVDKDIDENNLHLINVQTGKTEFSVGKNFSGFDGFSWSSDSRNIAIWRDGDKEKSRLIVVSIESGGEKVVGKGFDDGAIWLPDGKHILFSSSSDGLSHFWAVNADGSELMDWTKDKNAADSYLTLSPQGDQIAFLSIDLTKGKYYLYIANVAGTKRTNLTEVDTTIEGGPQWSPDGKQLAFVKGEGDKAKLYTIRLDTKQIHEVGELGKGIWFGWQP